jgi:hypothetical protein
LLWLSFSVDYMTDIESDFVHLARLALEGKSADVATLVRRTLRSLARRRPDLSDSAKRVLAFADFTNKPFRLMLIAARNCLDGIRKRLFRLNRSGHRR